MISTTQSVNKKAFTLIEVIISIVIISLIYSFAISNVTIDNATKDSKVTLSNLKQYLLKQEFDKSIELKCISKDFSCFVISDGEILEDMIGPLFDTKPDVYRYSKELKKIEYIDFEPYELQRFEIVFEYSCTKSGRCTELIVQSDDKSYIFNDMYNKPQILENLNDIYDYFDLKEREVRDAF